MTKNQYKNGAKVKILATNQITDMFDLGFSKSCYEQKEPDGVWITNPENKLYCSFKKFEELEII